MKLKEEELPKEILKITDWWLNSIDRDKDEQNAAAQQ